MNIRVENQPKLGKRILRSPIHHWNVRAKPFAIQPIFIAPVLPGETFKSAQLQSRVVTDPIKNRLIGWHQEYYIFYVKLTDLDGADDYKAMMLDPDPLASNIIAASNAKYYAFDDNIGIAYVEQCLKRVTETHFRDEGEAWDVVTIDGLPAAQLNVKNWSDSTFDTTQVDMEGATIAADSEIGDIDRSLALWEFLRANEMTEMSYEDYLRTHGVRGRETQSESHEPELMRYVRNWQYPSNTIDPDDGSATSVVSWAVNERADKDRYFAHPGFIFGVSVTRPKVYLGKQKGAVAQWLRSAFDWLPAIMSERTETSLREFTNAQGPLAGEVTNGYWVDVRDLYLWGDQFLNYDPEAATGGQTLLLPTTALQRKYPTEAMVDTLFTADTAEAVEQDGAVFLNILGHQRDHT